MYSVIKPDAVEIFDPNPLKHIEMVGRTCYKSEDMITDDSCHQFVAKMYDNGHHAMIEHFRFIVSVNQNIWEDLAMLNSPYIAMTRKDGRYIVSGSARAFMDGLNTANFMRVCGAIPEGDIQGVEIALLAIIKHIIWYYRCDGRDGVDELFGGNKVDYSACEQYTFDVLTNEDVEKLSTYEYLMHGWHSVKFTVDRGVTHELVRHRPASWAQESTRYCNYSRGKFGGCINVIKPYEFKMDSEPEVLWDKVMHYLNEMYQQMIKIGITPQWARSILPQSTKADIVCTASNMEWVHIINLRYSGMAGTPYPQMVEVTTELVNKYDWAKWIVDQNFTML